jgi:hypothetical protein
VFLHAVLQTVNQKVVCQVRLQCSKGHLVIAIWWSQAGLVVFHHVCNNTVLLFLSSSNGRNTPGSPVQYLSKMADPF